MADINIWGVTYPNVPAIDLPESGGGTARFWEAEDGDEMEYGSTVSDTWYFNESLSVPRSDIVLEDIRFESNNTIYTLLSISPWSSNIVYITYGGDFVYGPYYSPTSAVWVDESYRTITISGGTDAQDATFRAWLEANATQQ